MTGNSHPTGGTPQPRDNAGGFAPVHQEDDSHDILRIGRILWDRKWHILVITVLFVAIAAFQLKKATNIYVATSTIRYEPTSLRYIEFGEVGRPVNILDEVQTQIEIIRGPAVTEAVVEALGMDRAPARDGNDGARVEQSVTLIDQAQTLWRDGSRRIREALVPPPEVVHVADEERAHQGRIDAMRGKVFVSQVRDTKLINITVRDTDPVRAARIANEYATQYRNSITVNKMDSYRTVREFFDGQIAEARLKLRRSQQALLDFSEESNTDLKLLEAESDIALQMTRSLRNQIEQMKNDLVLRESEVASEEMIEAVDTHLLMQDAEYKRLVARVNELELERVALIAEDTEDNPRIVRLTRQLDNLRTQLEDHVGRFDLSRQGSIALMSANIEALQSRLREQEERFNRLQGDMIAYRQLQMEVRTQEELLNELLARASQIAVAEDIQPDNVSIHATAAVPSFPSEPRVMRTLAKNGVLGFFLGCVVALGMGWLDRSIHDPSKVEALTGLPALGVVPYMGGFLRNPLKRRHKTPLINMLDPYSKEAESFRMLRTNLQYSTAGRSPQIVMVTSCMAAEGKSTVSANLAIAFASKGERTLLIDADLKCPRLHGVFKRTRKNGLSDVLTGQEESTAAIAPTGIENLDLLCAGPPSPNPVELLDSEEMSRLLEDLRGRYQRIVLDTAPLSGLSDSIVISTRVDGLCLVASIGKTRTDVLRRVVRQMQGKPARMLGIVFNHQFSNRRMIHKGEYYGAGGYSYSGNRARGKFQREAS